MVYFRDTPCSDCGSYLTLNGDSDDTMVIGTGAGTFKPISFLLKDLLDLRKARNRNSFEIYYSESVKGNPNKILIFKIKLE